MPKQILIIDDNEDTCQILTRLLTREGYGVTLAKNGKEGLQKSEHSPPDLILLDVMLPEINGFEVCRTIKDSPPLRSIPIFIMSAGIGPALQAQSLNIGAEAFLTKPLRPHELAAKIRGYFDQHLSLSAP